MKIKGQFEITIKEEQEFVEENNFEDKDSILAELLKYPESFVNQEGVSIVTSNVQWVAQPKDEAFETEEEEDETEDDEDYNKTDV